MVDTPSASGNGQKIVRCPKCHVALWSHYSRRGTALAFVRAGTLNDPCAVTPDVHIFTSTKLPWIALPEGAQVFAEFYDVPQSLAARGFGAGARGQGSLANPIGRGRNGRRRKRAELLFLPRREAALGQAHIELVEFHQEGGSRPRSAGWHRPSGRHS